MCSHLINMKIFHIDADVDVPELDERPRDVSPVRGELMVPKYKLKILY